MLDRKFLNLERGIKTISYKKISYDHISKLLHTRKWITTGNCYKIYAKNRK